MAIRTKRGVGVLAKLAGGVSLAVLASVPAFAQDAGGPGGAGAPADEIIVTGIRASLEQAADIKREAAQVMDVITAEDVGKLPDANVAEALQRVTGVQITRVFGEGQSVSVRGLQQVRVEVDGRTLLGWSARLSPPENDQLGRSSGLDSVPSSLFGRLEVRKSPLASQAEGGLGGTVNLVTPKPLSFKEPTASLRVQGVYSENSDKFEPAITGFATTKFADDRIGIMIAGEYQKRTSVTQTFERNNFLNRTYTGPNGGVIPTPTLLQYEQFTVDRSRLGLNGAIQFEVTPEFTLTADALYSKLKTGRRQDFFAFRLPTGANPVTNRVVEDGMVVAGNANGTVTTASQIRNEPTESFLYGLNGKYESGGLTIEADGYYSKGTIDQTIQIITLQGTALVPGAFDFRGGGIPSLDLGSFDPTSYSSYNPATNGVRSNRLIGLLEEWTGKLDVSYETAGGVTISAGVRYTDLHARSNAFRSQVTPTRAEIEPFLKPIGGFLPDIAGNFPRSFLGLSPDYDYIFNRAQGAEPNPDANGKSTLLPNLQRDYDFSERTLAGYLMVSGEGEILGMPYKANAGVRIASTRLSVDSYVNVGSVSTLRNDRNRYTNVLPSANIAFNVSDNFLIRVSGSQTMQRASIADLAPSTFFNATNLSVTGGNVNLKPPISTQADISFEYYTGKSSLISGAVFYKDVQDFIASFVTTGVDLDLDDQGRELTFSRPENLASAKIKGFEIGIQQFADFLPSPFDGLGIIANYTYSDSEDNAGFPLVAVSKNSYNLVGLYEKGPFSARVAYNYRDEAVFEFSEGRPSFVGSRSQLDAQLGFDITENFALSLQAQNLMPKKSATSEYSNFNPTALNSYALSERRFSVGVRAKF
ncbi:iron complex outermembrane receptor protein [Sphingopyxis panaciterrae]|uniref:TonB-dependent receptor n=1 Tax=Sphingopyxis panaciterrae TaxID=363841 RepID=UPI0014217354|nr:TonB-dependent receptor [Sphingopyxis panaciterrae]NIJ39567.1 iron complex outermembrane receptor protein [Sphingopyxis panaciterrae]